MTLPKATDPAIQVPVLPNSPLNSIHEAQKTGSLRLRRSKALDFIENADFDTGLATYDQDYQNSQAHSKRFTAHMIDVLALIKRHLAKDSQIVEVGCGKGDFVELVQADGDFRILGFDATYDGDNKSISKRYLGKTDRIAADFVVLRHVLEHIPRPHDFLGLLKTIFGNAPIYIEVPNYDWIATHQAFFDLTYEHVNYFSKKALTALFNDDVTEASFSFGDQYQYVIANLASVSETFANQYDTGEWEELSFSALFPDLSQKITNFDQLTTTSRSIYIWGAATKGCMFLVHCLNQNKLINKVAFAIDENPKKVGKFLPLSLVQIQNKQAFFAAAQEGDLLIISNPIYEPEIMEELRAAGLKNIQVKCL